MRASADVRHAVAAVVVVVQGAIAVADTLDVPSEYATIQAGIDAAAPGDIVLVADGVYAGAGNTNIDFLGKPITVRSENGATHCTIDGATSARGFRFHSAEGADSILDGFSIVNGFGSQGGGGILIQACSPTIQNCIITDCYGFDFGGAIEVTGGNPLITNCTFAENYTDFFGGAFMVRAGAHPTITRCVFNGNTGLAWGGGVLIDGTNSGATILSCVFAGNDGAGIRNTSASGTTTVANSLFVGNLAFANGGGVGSYATNLVIGNCTFAHNYGPASGGLNAHGPGAALIHNSIFWGNVNTSDESAPGEVTEIDTVVNNSIIEGGWAGPGAGNSDADPLFTAGPGGNWTEPAVFDPQTNTTIFTDSEASFEPGSLAGRFFRQESSKYQITRLLHIHDNTATTLSVLGNFTAGFTQFFPTDTGQPYQIFDVRLVAGSPAIDAGDNSAVPAGVLTDLDGQPRFVDDPATADSGVGKAPIVDIGCFEFQPFSIADLNADGVVNVFDLLLVISNWGPCGSPDCPADIAPQGGDGVVNVADLLFLIANWG